MIEKFKNFVKEETKKVHWKISEAPTGRYKSFSKRGWPMGYADKDNNKVLFHIRSEDGYHPRKVKTGEHKPLSLLVAVRNKGEDKETKGSFTWRKVKSEFPTLKHAKEAAHKIYTECPHYFEED